MDPSKIPKPSSIKPPSTRAKIGITSKLPPKLEGRPMMLRRRSKSASDLRPPLIHGKLLPLKSSERQAVAPLRIGQKRPALQKINEENKPKVQKVKIPDWDYKSRFQELQKKHGSHLEELKHLRCVTADQANLAKECDTLRTDLKDLEAKLKESEKNKNTIREERDGLLQHYNLTLEKLEKNEKEYKNLRDSYVKIQKENQELRECKSKLDRLQIRANELENLTLQLRGTLEEKDVIRRELHNAVQDLKGNIRVFCRIRPAAANESDKQLCAIFCPTECSLDIRKCRESISAISGKAVDLKQEFTFDKVFPPEAQQLEIFEELSPLIQSALDGYHVCVFAYGQTGSGKTFTMQGSPQNHGMIPRTIDVIFESIERLSITDWTYTVSASFLEIYNENIRDLLVPNSTHNYELRYNEGRGVTVTNLQTEHISSAAELKNLMEEAHKNRVVAATDFNEHSSRSHAITKIHLQGYNKSTKAKLAGSLNLVDLAGSESAKTSSSERLVETKNINQSLSTLGNVMLALHNKDAHIPYRNSKLTFLLQSCLGGNSKTLMFVNISPFEECFNESINSLRFAAKVKEIKMSVKKNKSYHL